MCVSQRVLPLLWSFCVKINKLRVQYLQKIKPSSYQINTKSRFIINNWACMQKSSDFWALFSPAKSAQVYTHFPPSPSVDSKDYMYKLCTCIIIYCTCIQTWNFFPRCKFVIKLHVYSCKVERVLKLKEDINTFFSLLFKRNDAFFVSRFGCKLHAWPACPASIYNRSQNALPQKKYTCTIHAGFKFNRIQDFTTSQESSPGFFCFLFFSK